MKWLSKKFIKKQLDLTEEQDRVAGTMTTAPRLKTELNNKEISQILEAV